MKRSQFKKSLILFIKSSRLFASINTIRLVKKSPDLFSNGLNKNKPNHTNWSLDNFSGQWLILYFYPMVFSSLCTLEAKGFHNNLSKYKNQYASIVGISADKEADNESFCKSEKTRYTLLSDKPGDISKSYDSWLDTYSKRNTFIIISKGILVLKWIGIRPLGDAQEVLEKLLKQNKIYA